MEAGQRGKHARGAPLLCHQHPAGLPPQGAVAAHSGVTPFSTTQLRAVFPNRPREPPGVFPTSAPRIHLLSQRVKGFAWLGNLCNLEVYLSQVALTKLPLEILPKGRVCRKDLGALVNGKLSESVHKVRVCPSYAP